jgi:hypothetical protein
MSRFYRKSACGIILPKTFEEIVKIESSRRKAMPSHRRSNGKAIGFSAC